MLKAKCYNDTSCHPSLLILSVCSDCGSDGIPALNTVTRRRRVGSGLECQEYCAGIQGAEYFKWKKVRGGKERMDKCTVFRLEAKSAGASNLVSNQGTNSKEVL